MREDETPFAPSECSSRNGYDSLLRIPHVRVGRGGPADSRKVIEGMEAEPGYAPRENTGMPTAILTLLAVIAVLHIGYFFW